MTHPEQSRIDSSDNTIWFLGDTQSEITLLATSFYLPLYQDHNSPVFICCGDLTMSGSDAEWSSFLSVTGVYTDCSWASLPIFGAAMGNHEIIDGDGLSNWQSNLSGQHTATPAPHSAVEYWAETFGNVRLIAVDTTSDYTLTQRIFLRTQLKIANHWRLWPIIISHHSLYTGCVIPTAVDAPRMLPLIQEAEDCSAQIWLCGHTHRYERTYPLVRAVPATGGVSYITLGRSTNEGATDANPTKTDTLNGAPNIDRIDNYDAAVILAKQQAGAYNNYKVVNRLRTTANTLNWKSYMVINSSLQLFDEFSLSK